MAGTLLNATYFNLNGSAINNQENGESRADQSTISADSTGGFAYARQIVSTGVEATPYSFILRGVNNATGANAVHNVDQFNLDILIRRDAGSLNEMFVEFNDTANAAYAQLRFDASGNVALHDADALAGGAAATAATSYATQTTDRLHVQVDFTISTGAYAILVWTYTVDAQGDRIYTYRQGGFISGTANLGATPHGRVQMGRTANLNATSGTVTIFGAWISSGGPIQHLRGMVRTAASVASDNANWTASTGSDKAAMVDETTCDTTEADHGTYIEHAADGGGDAITFNLSSLNIPTTATIHARRNQFVIWNDAGTTGGQFQFRSVIGATTTDIGPVTPTDIAAGTGLPHGRGPMESVDPSTSAAWTYANLASEVIGVIAVDESTNRTYECSTIQQLVFYTTVTEVTVQPDSTTGIDATLNKTAADTNSPDTTTIGVGHTGTAFQRMLNVFPASIPAGQKIVSALYIPVRTGSTNTPGAGTCFLVSGNPGNIVENQVTWNTRSTTPGAWTTPGGDSQGTSVAITLPTAGGAFRINAQAMMAANYAAGNTTIGFIMKRDDETTADSARTAFGCCENATAGNRPSIVYAYTSSAGGGVSGARGIASTILPIIKRRKKRQVA